MLRLFGSLLLLLLSCNDRLEQYLPAPAGHTEGLALCNLGSLPSDIQNHLKADFGSWKIQEPANLSEYTRKTWAGRKPAAVGLRDDEKLEG